MGDGGFRPAYNVQYASDTESQIIVGVEVVTSGSDQGQLSPMVSQVGERCGQVPDNWLVDGGYPAHAELDEVADQTKVYAPAPKSKKRDIDVHPRKEGDSPAVAIGASEWPVPRPRSCTSSGPRPPNASTRRRATGG